MEQMPLFERLGGRDGVRRLTACIVDNHFANPAIATRFAAAAHSRDQMVDSVTEFFCTGVLLHRPERRAHLRRPSGARRPHRDEHQRRGQVRLAAGDTEAARERFGRAARGFEAAGQPLDARRCRALAATC